jgi:hypothetical protein
MSTSSSCKRNYAQEYKKRVKFSPLFSTIAKTTTRDFMLDEATSKASKKQGDVVIIDTPYNIGRRLKNFTDLAIKENPELKKFLPKTLPRYRDNASLDIELSSLTLASYQLEQNGLQSIPFTLLLSRKTYTTALNSGKPVTSYLADRISKQLKKHTGETIDFVFHLEVKEVLINTDGKLEKHKLPHIHGNVICNGKQFGDGDGYDSKATVRNALKSINACKRSQAFSNNVEKFNKHELRGDFKSRKHQTTTQAALGWAHYISKDALTLIGKSWNDEKRGNPKTLPEKLEKLFAATRNLRRHAEEIYNEIRDGYSSTNQNIKAWEQSKSPTLKEMARHYRELDTLLDEL